MYIATTNLHTYTEQFIVTAVLPYNIAGNFLRNKTKIVVVGLYFYFTALLLSHQFAQKERMSSRDGVTLDLFYLRQLGSI